MATRAALFWATIGGMGLTGAILRATVALQRTETAYFSVDTDRCSDIDDLMQKMADRRRGLHLLGCLVRRRDQRTPHGPGGAHPRQQGPPRRAAGEAEARPAEVRRAVAGHRPRDLPQPDDQQGDRQGVQRDLVPQGAQASSRRTAEHHPVLPPARHRGGVESGVRAEWLPAVPVRRAVRPGRAVPALPGDDRQLGPPVVSQRAQAIRRQATRRRCPSPCLAGL